MSIKCKIVSAIISIHQKKEQSAINVLRLLHHDKSGFAIKYYKKFWRK